MNRNIIEGIIESLKAGETPELPVEAFPAFSEAATRGNAHLGPEVLARIAAGLGTEDIPTFERALKAIDAGELAWLGFKAVYDPALAVSNVDNAVTKNYGEVGSADGRDLVFFYNDAKECVSSRKPSPRDKFQMKDVTRGPSMHNEQFEGLIWCSVALFDPIKVWLLGGSDVAVELAKLASHNGFDVVVADYDPAYVNEERFPDVERILLPGGNFDALAEMTASPADYVCVLTRGHMFDPDSCIWAAGQGVHYIGMMGCAGKNDTVYKLVTDAGVTDEQWDRIKRPIGLKFGAKTPAELAIAIVAELIDVRYKQRYSQEARDMHDKNLGR